MNNERENQLFPPDQDSRFMILYGKGIDDTFISPQYDEKQLEEILLSILKQRGHQRVIFYSPHKSIYYMDEASHLLSQPKSLQPKMNSIDSSDLMMSGPLGNINLIQPQNTEGNQPLVVGDIHALRNLDAYIREPDIRTAIIFVQAESALRYFDDPRTLAGIIGNWTRLPASNENMCLCLFSTDSYPGLCEITKSLPIPELTNFILRQKHERSHIFNLIRVNGPGPKELENLIQMLTLRRKLEVKPTDLQRLVDWMSVEDVQASQWMRRLRSINYLDLQIAIEKGWFSGRANTFQSPVDRLNNLVGLTTIKQRVHELTSLAAYESQYRINGSNPTDFPALHMVFKGNPGTGKTSVARLFGEIYHEIGILRRGHLIEARAADLIDDHVGGTALKTNSVIEQSLDGVLFIDEAYALTEGDRGGFGQEAVDTLISSLEDFRNRMVVIVAGYPRQMEKFLSSNPGLRRRFPQGNIIDFPDYSAEELELILLSMFTQKNVSISNQMKEKLREIIVQMVHQKDENFGNAGEMRNLSEAVYRIYANRIMNQNQVLPRKRIIITKDIPLEYQAYLPPVETIPDGLFHELDELVGLDEVKTYLHRLINRISLENLRYKKGLSTQEENQFQHLVFCGNPGTGKTTVAKLVGKMYRRLGLLRKGHCIEVSRADLVAGYVGQTAIKTMDRIREALDGVLFIDEAYSLIGTSKNDYGSEALSTLVKAMEDNRKRLVVIVAGYPHEMEEFLSSNPGLRSRFNPPILFPDFQIDDLLEIIKRLAIKEKYFIDEIVLQKLKEQLDYLKVSISAGFGNARQAIDVYQGMKTNLAERVLALADPNIDQLSTFVSDDVPLIPDSIHFGEMKILTPLSLYPSLKNISNES
jgi:SpoVK/Ycf46/Vps4 family AAA+-type ATPase